MLRRRSTNSWNEIKKSCEKAAKGPLALACATDETILWSRPTAKQRQNPCPGPAQATLAQNQKVVHVILADLRINKPF